MQNYDATRFDPPAPVALVTVKCPERRFALARRSVPQLDGTKVKCGCHLNGIPITLGLPEGNKGNKSPDTNTILKNLGTKSNLDVNVHIEGVGT